MANIKKRTPKRSIINRKRNVLSAPEKEGFVRRVVNDVDGRIAEMQELGYVVVDDATQLGDRGITNQNQSLGTGARKNVGNGITGILMEIPKEDYDAMQKEKAEEVDRIEEELKRNLNNGQDGNYGGVKIERR